MVIEYLRRETYGVVVGLARRPFDDFTHFRPSVLRAFPGINLPYPLHTAALDGGADTRCNRAGLFCAPSLLQTGLLALCSIGWYSNHRRAVILTSTIKI